MKDLNLTLSLFRDEGFESHIEPKWGLRSEFKSTNGFIIFCSGDGLLDFNSALGMGIKIPVTIYQSAVIQQVLSLNSMEEKIVEMGIWCPIGHLLGICLWFRIIQASLYKVVRVLEEEWSLTCKTEDTKLETSPDVIKENIDEVVSSNILETDLEALKLESDRGASEEEGVKENIDEVVSDAMKAEEAKVEIDSGTSKKVVRLLEEDSSLTCKAEDTKLETSTEMIKENIDEVVSDAMKAEEEDEEEKDLVELDEDIAKLRAQVEVWKDELEDLIAKLEELEEKRSQHHALKMSNSGN